MDLVGVRVGARKAWDHANDLGAPATLGKRDWTLPDVGQLPNGWPNDPLGRCVAGAVDGALNGLWLLPFTPSNPGDLAWNLILGCASGVGGGSNSGSSSGSGSGSDPEIAKALERAKTKKIKFPGHDGKTFENYNNQLPHNADPDYYTEWAVETPGVSGLGLRRLVIGKGGEVYYSPDHYESFQRIR